MKKLKIPVIIFIIISGLYFLLYHFNSPKSSGNSSSLFIVKHGEDVKSIALNLVDEGYIRSDFFFVTLVRLSRKTRSIKSGQYNLEDKMKNTDILRILSRGIVATIKFTVPEGYNIKQIAELLESRGIISSGDFLDACSSADLLDRYKIPFENAEGFLFPDTYIIAKDLKAHQIAEVMIKKFFENLHNISYMDYTQQDLKKTIIIASLVEREARLEEERPIIAAVFYNRLQKGKRLESCATVQYVLGKTKERLLFSDLKVNSPYNTYIHSGLPPGPIANPGISSLNAAINPADVDFLFFVSKRDGSHYFSSTYKEHLNAIQKYSISGRVGHQVS